MDHALARTRRCERNRQRRRRLLADIESGLTWQQQKHMARVERFFRDGPVIRVSHVIKEQRI